EAHCRARGQRFLRFDYSGHGQSGGDFMDCAIGDWAADALAMLDKIAPGENVLVGSSMGGWIMLLAALARREKVRGLVGIAAAPDFTERLIWQQFSPAQKQELQERGVVYVPGCYDDQAPYPLTRHLIEEGRSHLLLHAPIALEVPVRLLHGLNDKDVPWQMAQQLSQQLTSQDVALTLVKGGGHRLSAPDQLAMLCQAVDNVLRLASR
ncbi:MAG: alpha/beta hydrolase, partial [Alphaproteobacteria bacterium]|nr:alpha/beta hydrolase [Alphaproteobacteria bacterium]